MNKNRIFTGIAAIAALSFFFIFYGNLSSVDKFDADKELADSDKLTEIIVKKNMETEEDREYKDKKPDLILHASPYIGLLNDFNREFTKTSNIKIELISKSFPLGRHLIKNDNPDIIWFSHGDYASRFIQAENYKKTDLEYVQKTALWVKEEWASDFDLKAGQTIKLEDLAVLSANDRFKFILSNPALSVAGYSILSTAISKNIYTDLFNGLESLSGNDGLMYLQITKAPDANGFFMDESLGDYLFLKKSLPDGFVKLNLENQTNNNYNIYINKENKNQNFDNWIEYLKSNKSLLAKKFGLFEATNRINYVNNSLDTTEKNDLAIGEFLRDYSPEINSHLLINTTIQENVDFNREAISYAFNKIKNNNILSYPWSGIKEKEKISFILYLNGKIEFIDFNNSDRLSKSISKSVKSKSFELIKSAYDTYAYNYEEGSRNQFVLISDGTNGIDQEFSDFFEELRTTANKIPEKYRPRVLTIAKGDFKPDYLYSIAGLTGGSVFKIKHDKKDFYWKMVKTRHNF
jgi:hypothetical protein